MDIFIKQVFVKKFIGVRKHSEGPKISWQVFRVGTKTVMNAGHAENGREGKTVDLRQSRIKWKLIILLFPFES